MQIFQMDDKRENNPVPERYPIWNHLWQLQKDNGFTNDMKVYNFSNKRSVTGFKSTSNFLKNKKDVEKDQDDRYLMIWRLAYLIEGKKKIEKVSIGWTHH